jgi:RNA polymerase sigma factor (sigma-70 family)
MSYNDDRLELTTWLDNAGRYPLLPAERVNSIAKQIQSLPEDSPKRRKLVNVLVQHNLRLVPRFVHGFMDRCSHNKWGSVETIDYLQTGVIGLIRAAEKFDPTRGYTFATYATFWIRSKVSKYNMKTLSAVTVSESASRQLTFYKRNGYLRLRNGTGNASQSQIDELERTVSAAYSCASLNVANENNCELIDMVPDKNESSINDASIKEIEAALDKAGVSQIGKDVLISNVIKDETFKEIGKRLGISIIRVKSEKDRAVRVARAHPRAFELV